MKERSAARQALLDRLLRGEAAPRDVNAVVPRAPGAVVPISADQEHVWLHAALAPDVPLYNEPITIHRRGKFDVERFRAAFNEVLRRHEIWRTAFEVTADGIVQRVQEGLTLDLPLVDLTHLPAEARTAEAVRIAYEDAKIPFDMSVAPLMRGRIFRFSEEEHRLYLTLHHIIFDGVSIYRILVPTLASIYEDFPPDHPGHVKPPPLQYGDYAIWRARHLESAPVLKQLDYWRANLAGELPVLRLPADHPPPPMPTYRGSMETFSISSALTAALKKIAAQIGVTNYALLLTAYKTLLFRYSGQTDLIVGGVADTRRHRTLEPLMGYFLNSFCIRTKPSAELPFAAYARQTGQAVVGALDASDVPFARVVREIHPKRDAGSHPLFQVLFSIEPQAPHFEPGWDLTQMDVTTGAGKFDLYLELDELPEGHGLIGRFLYSLDTFTPPTIRRMIAHWRNILETIAANSEQALGEMSLLTEAEQDQLSVWNSTARPWPDATLHSLFETQATAKPKAIAICEDDESPVSYGALDRRANGIAAQLRESGIGSGALVAVCVERSSDMIATFLGIAKTGAAYMPLDPTLPRARIAHCLDEAKPGFLLTQPHFLNALPQADLHVLFLDTESDEAAPEAPPAANDPDSLAYVLCTSGTTGKPKAVEITHRSLVNLLLSMRDRPGFTQSDSLLAVTTPSFDIAGLEMFLPLISGGRVILARNEVSADPLRLADLMQRMAPTVMQATPSTWRGLIDSGWQGLPSLKILCGGEALSRELADGLVARAAQVWNMYGPTETTIWSTIEHIQPGTGPITIGKPIANTTVFVLDAAGHALPAGVAGELHIGGAGVARGYRHQPALTAQRFRKTPAAPGQILYRTGDIARLRDDGTLECLGRTDDQVKIRGHRLALGEIEAALEAHPSVAAAAVKARPDASGGLGLCAYLVPRADGLPPASDLRALLRATLPDYMLPAQYVQIAALPLTPIGKLDRAALPDTVGQDVSASRVAPRTPQETRLAQIFAGLLGVSGISVEDNFFEIGGHSLLAVRLVRQIEQAFGCRLPIAAIFEAPSVAQLATRLGAQSAASGQTGSAQDQDVSDRETMLLFESLGDDCEFGFVQRRYGAEPLSLLRFTGMTIDDLVAALDDRLSCIADPAVLRVEPGSVPGEYVVSNDHYRSGYLFFGAADLDPEAIKRAESAKLRAMRPMLLRTLERGSRIAVFRSRDPVRPDQIEVLRAVLRRFGPTCLLWVRLADAVHPAGSVAWLGENFLGGAIDRFSPESDPQDSSAMWLSLCQEARRMWRAARAEAA